jgi:hypothetical protein
MMKGIFALDTTLVTTTQQTPLMLKVQIDLCGGALTKEGVQWAGSMFGFVPYKLALNKGLPQAHGTNELQKMCLTSIMNETKGVPVYL